MKVVAVLSAIVCANLYFCPGIHGYAVRCLFVPQDQKAVIGHFTVVCLVSWLGLKARVGLTLF